MDNLSDIYINSKLERKKFNFKEFIFKIFLVFCVIYNSGYALSITEQGQQLSLITLIICSVILFINHVLHKGLLKQKIDLSFAAFLYFLIFFLFSAIINAGFSTFNSFLKPFLIITVAYFLTQNFKFNSFIFTFINIMKILSITALLAYFLVIILGINLNLKIFTNFNGVNYYNGFIFYFIIQINGLSSRLMSIFWEPGLFASFLLLAMVLEICFKPKIEILNIILFCFTLIMTKSTAGILILPLVFVIYLAKRLHKNKFTIFFIILIFFILLLILYFDKIYEWLLTINYQMFAKLNLNDSISSRVRFDAPLVNLEIFKESPLFGMGFSNANLTFSQKTDISQTSTSTLYLAALGIPGILYTLFWIYSILKLKTINIVMKIAFILIILLILNKEPHTTLLFTYCILFYLLKTSTFPLKKLVINEYS